MKKLSELGICPAPWRFTNYGVIDLLECGVVYSNDCPYLGAADARLIAAAPKMYARAWELITAFDERIMSPKHIEELRKALAEAAGEEVGDGQSS